MYSNQSEIALDGYEQRESYWTDSFDNHLNYFEWGKCEPNKPMKERFLLMKSSGSWLDGPENRKTNVVCVKCSEWYAIPEDYECHDTDFGTVVIKVELLLMF